MFLLSFFFILSLFSCNRPCKWSYQEVHTKCLCYNSASLHSICCTPVNGIRLEFLKGSCGIRTTIAVECREILPAKENPDYAPITVQIGEEFHYWMGKRLAGNQRLILSEEDSLLLVNALCNNIPVKIYLTSYFEEISPAGFANYWSQFLSVETD